MSDLYLIILSWNSLIHQRWNRNIAKSKSRILCKATFELKRIIALLWFNCLKTYNIFSLFSVGKRIGRPPRAAKEEILYTEMDDEDKTDDESMMMPPPGKSPYKRRPFHKENSHG